MESTNPIKQFARSRYSQLQHNTRKARKKILHKGILIIITIMSLAARLQ